MFYLLILQNFKDYLFFNFKEYFEELLRTAASVLLIIKLVKSIGYGMVSATKVRRSGQSLFCTNY